MTGLRAANPTQLSATTNTIPTDTGNRGQRLDRLSFEQLEEQRSKMTLRLRSFNVPDIRLHRRATVELEKRLDDWLGNALAPLSRFADIDPRGLSLPVEVTTDQVELLIVHVLGLGEEFGEFGVSPNGAAYILDPDNGKRVFLSGLSPLLDEATDIFSSFTCGGGEFFEHNGHFITDDGTIFLTAELREKVPNTEQQQPGGKSFWRQIVSVLPWVHDEPTAEPRSTPRPPPQSPDSVNDRPIYRLHVNFDTGRWPSTGVLGEMGYKVGKDGLPTASRREILQQVLRVELVAASGDAESYIREWGSPGSNQRVVKMYNAVTAFSRNAQRRNADYSEAIADWESDLDWLESTYGLAD